MNDHDPTRTQPQSSPPTESTVPGGDVLATIPSRPSGYVLNEFRPEEFCASSFTYGKRLNT